MGVLNVTPDSFSDGGLWLNTADAVAHGLEMVADGAAVIDVGGESTRPGATSVSEDEEMRRVLPVIEALAPHVRVSVDTRRESVARAAVGAGATIINDVSASLWRVAAETGSGWVAMHMPANPSVMQQHAHYEDVVAEVLGYVLDRAEQAARAGVTELWIDPGIGFGKTAEHNLQLLRNLRRFVATGWPVLVGTSRKSFLGRLTQYPDGTIPPAADRLEATVASTAWSILQGAHMVRVHEVRPAVHAAFLAGGAGVPADMTWVRGGS